MVALLFLLILNPAVAGDDCGDPVGSVAADVIAVLNVEPSVMASPVTPESAELPTGVLTLANLEQAFEQLAEDGAALPDFFALLADGQHRTLSGDVVRGALEKYGVSMPFLPTENLLRIESDGRELTVVLDFGRHESRKIKLPTTSTQVVSATDSDDPYNTSSTELQTVSGGGHSLVVQETLTLGISKKGLTSIDGLSVKKIFSFGLDGHSQHIEGKVAQADGMAVVRTDSAGQPLIEDGHYVPDVYDDWLLLEVAGRTLEIGVPALESKK